MDSQEAARRWAATWTVAWQTHDVESVVDLYADECVHRSTPFRLPHYGRQGVRDYLTQAFADEQRIDEVRFGTPVVQGDRAWVEYWARLATCPSSAQTAPVGSSQLRLAGHSVECGLVRTRRAWRKDCETAHGSVMIRAVTGGSGRDPWNDPYSVRPLEGA